MAYAAGGGLVVEDGCHGRNVNAELCDNGRKSEFFVKPTEFMFTNVAEGSVLKNSWYARSPHLCSILAYLRFVLKDQTLNQIAQHKNLCDSAPIPINLDAVPPNCLTSLFGILQSTPEDKELSVVLTFTTRGANIPLDAGSQDFRLVLAAIPFVRRTHINIRKIRHRAKTTASGPIESSVPEPFHLNRTWNAMHLTLPYLLAEFTRSSPETVRPMTIVTVQNISHTYASSLDTYATTLENTKSTQADFIACWDEEGWREEQFFARWEAALVREGFLAR
jgi:hypothetical protein